jgi:hypothetical protein
MHAFHVLKKARHMYLSGLWLGVDVRAHPQRDACLKEIRLHA